MSFDAIGAFDASVAALGHSYHRDFMPEPVTAFFDESGKLANNEFVCFGGIASEQSNMLAFANTWSDLLIARGLPHFSMKEAMNFTGPFEGWRARTSERDQLLRDLLLSTSQVNRVSCAFSSIQFRALPQEERKAYHDPAYMLFEGCVKAVISRNPQVGIIVTCDLSEEYSERCLKMYHKMRKRWPEIKQRCFALSFADDERLPQLQAADMIAYLQRASKIRESRAPEAVIAEMIGILERKREVQTVHYQERELGGAVITPPAPTK